MEELVDVLDERGMYIGKTETRANCSKEGLWHKAVCVFIINSKGQVLLQKRSANKKTYEFQDITNLYRSVYIFDKGYLKHIEFGYTW